MFTEHDLQQIKDHSLSVEQIERQLDAFKKGFPFLKLSAAATVGNGILRLGAAEEEKFINEWESYLAAGGHILKFVPASGAASRMFKNLFSFVDGDRDVPTDSFMKNFFDEIHKFAFYDRLNAKLEETEGATIDQLMKDGKYKTIVSCLLMPKGLNYGSLPKAMLDFHKVGSEVHTAMEEHLEEGAQYAKNSSNEVNLHFTVSEEHKSLFDDKLKESMPVMASKFGCEYNVTLSTQKPSTDTIAVNKDNTPFRENGKLLFRPGGHGALIENLNDVDTDVVFIKNIDNVVPSTSRKATIRYKKIIGGVLVEVQKKIAEYLELLDSGKYTMEQVREIVRFLQRRLCVRYENVKHLEDSELVVYLKHKLNRPIRVCGVVKNEGEPGGGPYIAFSQDGTTAPQILESSQIDTNNSESMELMRGATHFNPVDLVCFIRDYKGNKFDLTKFVDHKTGFISEKSKFGHEIKALELPGLWNGAMSDWNTVFVEVPVETFNPVKTVNDLLRPAHQA